MAAFALFKKGIFHIFKRVEKSEVMLYNLVTRLAGPAGLKEKKEKEDEKNDRKHPKNHAKR